MGAQSYSKHTKTGARSKESSDFRGRQVVLTSALNSHRTLGKPQHLSRALVSSSVKGAKREGQGRGAATRPKSLAQSPAECINVAHCYDHKHQPRSLGRRQVPEGVACLLSIPSPGTDASPAEGARGGRPGLRAVTHALILAPTQGFASTRVRAAIASETPSPPLRHILHLNEILKSIRMKWGFQKL